MATATATRDYTERKPCGCTREHFLTAATPLKLALVTKAQLDALAELGQPVNPAGVVDVEPKEFKPAAGAAVGSFGWGYSGKVLQVVGGVPLSVQCGFNLTVVNSKTQVG